MDEPKLNHYLVMAETLGVDTRSPRQVEDLIVCLRYCDLRFSNRKLRDLDICEQIGIPLTTLIEIKRGSMIQIATRVVLTEFLTDEARSDVRNKLFTIYQEYMPKALLNLAQIATAETPDDVRKPGYRDQIAAAHELINNPLASAWMSNTFLGEAVVLDETEHLRMREKLLAQKRVLQLDDGNTIDAEVTDLPTP